jgi:predicted ATPase
MAVFSPLIEDIVAISRVSNAIVNSLDTKTKREKRISAVVSLVMNMANEHPICLVFDNANWMDSSSAQLLKEITESDANNVLMVFSSRGDDLPDNLPGRNSEQNICLRPFTSDVARNFVMTMCDMGEEFAEIVANKTGGNPLFLKELVLSGSSSMSKLPDSIYDVVMIKLDQLASAERSALRNASIIGQVFDANVLTSISNSISK